jgi:hypothetical protein
MGLTGHSPKISDTPRENEDTRRTKGLRDSCRLTKMEHNRNSRKPPHISNIPSKLLHVRQYTLDVAYVGPQRTNETMSKQRSHIYGTLRDKQINTEKNDEILVVRKYPDVNWKHLWINLHRARISDNQRSTWYMVIHDLIPTNNRLAAVNLTETNRCSTCDDIDTAQHRLTQCG